MIAGDPPIPIPPVTFPLLSFKLDLEPAAAGHPQGINQMCAKHFCGIFFYLHSMSMIYISKVCVSLINS